MREFIQDTVQHIAREDEGQRIKKNEELIRERTVPGLAAALSKQYYWNLEYTDRNRPLFVLQSNALDLFAWRRPLLGWTLFLTYTLICWHPVLLPLLVPLAGVYYLAKNYYLKMKTGINYLLISYPLCRGDPSLSSFFSPSFPLFLSSKVLSFLSFLSDLDLLLHI